MNKKIVVALGGNALGNTPDEQKQAVKVTTKAIADLVEDGYQVIVSHGNGPQVGMINQAMDIAYQYNDKIPQMPFAECGAMSQGYIGFHLQNALNNEFIDREINKKVATIVTQVLVDIEDQAFKNPTKPIGSFYTKEEAEAISQETGVVMKEDAGRGYRRVIASPKPLDILEKDLIKSLAEDGNVIIAGGGGGIPVWRDGNSFEGIDAVVDKDFTSAKLADLIDCDTLLILTAVDKVAINFGKENQEDLHEMLREDASRYISDGQFAKGSMLPKIQAAMSFLEAKEGRQAIITSLEKASSAINGEAGTIIK
ncbi:carbamate kinase [uncultured Anaerococcus sp.]|uniref:carbamate kinase n=1 Tax=uncultured Anaerococcus sp. TaxID=293428 RepID=UPI002610ABC5|nr:carbamate kinase [uncultured Anaerococcus sp.]